MSRRSRDKGARFERHLVNHWTAVGLDARRTLQYRGAAGDGADVVLEGVYHVEAKHWAKPPNAHAAMRQAREDCAPDMIPIAVVKHDRAETLVVLPLEVFDALLKGSLGMERTGE